MTSDSANDPHRVEWFGATSGRLSGITALVLAALFVVFTLTGTLPRPWVGIAAVLAWVAWVVMLRPRLGVSSTDLVLRGMLSTTTVPLGRVQKYVVRQVFAVWADDRRYVSAAVGRGRRQAVRPVATAQGTMHYADAVIDRIRGRVRDAVPTGAPVTRAWAWPEIGAGVAAVALLVVLIVV